jgi:TPR repeat protein
MYYHGKGVEKDRTQAYLWLSLAAQHGIGTALNELESVVKEMSAEEKGKGAALFEQWRARTKSNENQVALYPMPG